MALDPSIALQTRGVALPDPLQQFGNALQIQTAQQRNELARVSAMREQQQYDDSQASTNALRAYYGSGQTDADLTNLGRTAPSAYASETKRRLDAEKVKADARRDNAAATKDENADKIAKYAQVAQFVRGARNQQEYDAAIQHGMAVFGLQQIPQWLDPKYSENGVRKVADTLLTEAQRLQAQNQQQTLAETGRHNRSTEGLTARGQNMTDARARDSLALTQAAGQTQLVDGGDGVGQLLVDKRTGQAKQVMGPDGQPLIKTRPLTEVQGKALQFGTRMSNANELLTNLEKEGVNSGGRIKEAVSGVPIVGGAMGTAANIYTSENQQKYGQAKQDFILAALRDESGAAIGSDEYVKYERAFFPQIGDPPSVIAQKAKARENTIKTLGQRVGGNQGAALTAPAATLADDPITAELKRRGAVP